jgi:hypothetical protein
LTNIERGDYVWIEPRVYVYEDTDGDGEPDDIETDDSSGEPVLVNDTHGFMVVGWGPIEECNYAIDISSELYPDFVSASGQQVVPYVTDFSGPTQDSLQIQASGPRPFYCSWVDGAYAKDTRPGTEEWTHVPLYPNPFGLAGRHNWYFYKVPPSLTLPVSEIYFSQEWSWVSNTGIPVVSAP